MITLLHGISGSQKPFFNTFTLSLVTTAPNQPIGKGFWTHSVYPYNDNAYLYFNIESIEDTSSAIDRGIVYNSSPNPTILDGKSSFVIPITNATYSTPSTGTTYLRAFADYGSYVKYSNEVVCEVPDISFNTITTVYSGFMNYDLDITLSVVCTGTTGIVTSSGIIVHYSGVGDYPNNYATYDPRWNFLGNMYGTSAFFTKYDQYDDIVAWIRGCFVIDWVTYWSGLVTL